MTTSSSRLLHPTRVMWSYGIVLSVVLMALGIAPVAAEAKSASNLIVINEGIGSVHIGQTLKQVQQAAGTPTSKSTAAMSWYYDNKPPYAQVGFGKNKRVDLMSPNSARDKTSKGIGEGSSEAQVQAAYANATCGPQPGPGGTSDLSCEIIKHLPGGKTIDTSFTFSTANGSGGVSSIYISEFLGAMER
jgi:hypothetical protein